MNLREHRRFARPLVLAVVMVAAALAVGVGDAGATSFYACTNGPADQSGLQTLINAGGTITITGTCRGNWVISTADVRLQAGSPGTTLNGNAAGPVLNVTGGRTATVSGLVVTNGSAGGGGGIFAHGSGTVVNVVSSTLRGNSGGNGGAIEDQTGAVVNVTGSTLTGNTASFGGAICSFSALNVTNSTITGNSASVGGGGVCSEFATVSITGSRLVSNSAFEGGGFAAFGGGGGVTLTNTQVDHNSLVGVNPGGGGILNDAAVGDANLTLNGTSVSFNTALHGGRGGGIFQAGGSNGTANLVTMGGSLLQGNQVSGAGGTFPGEGGAIYSEQNGGPTLISLTDTTVGPAAHTLNGNRADYGGGIYNNVVQPGLGLAGVTLGSGAHIVGNTAAVAGGGVFNNGGVITVDPGAVLLGNHPNNCTGC